MFDRYSYRDFIYRYFIPLSLCLIVTVGTIKVYRIYDHYWNDHLAFHEVVNLIRTGRIQILPEKTK